MEMLTVVLKKEITFAGEILPVGTVLELPIKSATALVNEGGAALVDVEE